MMEHEELKKDEISFDQWTPEKINGLWFWSQTGFLAETAATKQGDALKPMLAFFCPFLFLLPMVGQPLNVPKLFPTTHARRDCRLWVGMKTSNWRQRKTARGKSKLQQKDLAKHSYTVRWYFTCLQLQLQISPICTGIKQWPFSISWLGWQRLQLAWEDLVFQNLGSIDAGQPVTNRSVAVNHDGCCRPRNTTETVRLPSNVSASNLISFHLPSNQLLEKLTCFSAAREQI